MFDLTPPGNKNTNQVQLLVGGRVYEGWLSFSIVKTLEAPSGSFDLAISDRWPGQTAPWPIAPGDECQLNLGGEVMVTGYVDEVNYSLSGETRDLTVSGRDKTGDLVDCSFVEKTNQWRGSDAGSIASALAAPFGIPVKAEGGEGEIKNFKVEPGETAFEAIARLCKLKGLLAWPDNTGGLNLGPAGAESLGLTIDETDCISMAVTYSFLDRYSDYEVKGQRPTVNDGRDAGKAKDDTQVKETAKDPAVNRYRPLLLISEGAGAEAAERALWEASARAGRDVTVTVTLPGYRHKGGALWPLNKLVGVKSAGLALADELLISEIKFDCSPQGGHTTTLKLCRPDAFKADAVKDDKRKEGGAGAGFPPGTVVFGDDDKPGVNKPKGGEKAKSPSLPGGTVVFD